MPVDDGLAPREDTPAASTVWGWCYCGAYLHESEVADHLVEVHGVGLEDAEWVAACGEEAA